jgi:hypothetical protein
MYNSLSKRGDAAGRQRLRRPSASAPGLWQPAVL